MRLSKSWIIAAKDFKTYRRKKNIIYSLIAAPTIVTVLLPLVITYAGHRNGANGIAPAELLVLLPAFTLFYVILGTYLPTPIASYTIVGEKVEKSLEPLLATPTTDDEILLGKGISAFLPPIGVALAGSLGFMGLMNLATYSKLGYYYFPNWDAAATFFLIMPLATLMSVQVNVIVSSRISDVRTGQQVGILTILPFAGLYVSGELGIVDVGVLNSLLEIAAVVAVVDVLLFFVARSTFRREEILTRWK